MMPLTLENQDLASLQQVGMASIQIVHDLKNQLNGLKLYATFLRKRLETSERPPDELEAIAKLIAGLERTAAELTTLVRYGRPVELRKQPSVSLDKMLLSLLIDDKAREVIHIQVDDVAIVGEFDSGALTEALRTITEGALRMRLNGDPLKIHLAQDIECESPSVFIKWSNLRTSDHDVFRTFAGGDGLRMALAAKIIEAHQGKAEQQVGLLRVSLPIQNRVI